MNSEDLNSLNSYSDSDEDSDIYVPENSESSENYE